MKPQDIIIEMESRIEQALQKLVDRDQDSDVYEIRLMADAYTEAIDVVKAIAKELRTGPFEEQASADHGETLLEFLNEVLPNAWFDRNPETGGIVVTSTIHQREIEVRIDGETVEDSGWFELKLPNTNVWERWEMLDSWTFEGLGRWLIQWERDFNISIDEMCP